MTAPRYPGAGGYGANHRPDNGRNRPDNGRNRPLVLDRYGFDVEPAPDNWQPRPMPLEGRITIGAYIGIPALVIFGPMILHAIFGLDNVAAFLLRHGL